MRPRTWALLVRFHWLRSPRAHSVQKGAAARAETADAQRGLRRTFHTMQSGSVFHRNQAGNVNTQLLVTTNDTNISKCMSQAFQFALRTGNGHPPDASTCRSTTAFNKLHKPNVGQYHGQTGGRATNVRAYGRADRQPPDLQN